MAETDVKPRKLPRQARAKATVDAIVEATAQLLLREGYARFTTARVAERAGVSIGSLYQYFPNKAALASAVIDRCCEDFLAAFRDSAAGGRHATLDACVRAIVGHSLISHRLTPELHRIVRELAPRIGVTDRTAMVSRAMAKLIEALLREHADEIAPGTDLALAATIVETLLEALAHKLQLAEPAPVADDALAGEAVRLITRYLAADA